MQRAIPEAPPRDLMDAMQRMRSGDDREALRLAEDALPAAKDRSPYLALASLAALRLHLPDRAVPLLRELLAINPQDGASKANLANALIDLGRMEEAMKLVRDGREPSSARIRGYLLQQKNDLEGAAVAYRMAIEADQGDLASWNNLGNVLTQLGDTEGAIEAFEHAISLAPADVPIYHNLAKVLESAERHEARSRVLRDVLERAPDDYKTLLQLGLSEAQLDRTDEAIEALRGAVRVSPGFSDAHIELGMLYESLNRVEDLAALAQSIDPADAPPEADFLYAWRARRAGDFEQARTFAETIPESIHPMRRFHLIGGIADRLGDIDTAFAAYQRMNEEARQTTPPPPGPSFRDEVQAHMAKWTKEWAASWSPAEIDDGLRDPIFLVGFPRSGTTLLDTMLMGQPILSVLEERPMLARTIRLLGQDEDMADLPEHRIRELRNAYFEFARQSGWDDSRWLVDKHPLNMERVPTIYRLFPNARIILAERHPFDVVLSCFMANFTMNQAMRSFSSLDEAALTYDAVFSSWELSTRLFPVQYRAVRYERLVEDPDAELRPLVAWLGLEWSEDIVRHTETAKTRGRVRTASYSQIGEQLYTRARYRWRRYADHLAPVLPVLTPWAEKMGYETE